MIPGISLFGLTVGTYSLMAAVAAVTFMAMSFRPLRRCGLSLPGLIILLSAVCAAFLVGARLLNVAVNPDFYNAGNPWYRLSMGGFSMYGGVAGVLIVILLAALIARLRPLKLLDSITVPGAVSFCIARVGCFLSGCCGGKETALPWGVVFPQADSASAPLTQAHAVHPTQLYELILALLGIPICRYIVKKARAGEGGLFFIYAVWFSLMRFAVLWFRSLPYSALVKNLVYPLIYYVIIVIGMFLFVWSCRKGRL